MTRLADVARASARVAENPGRLAKIRELAGLLKRLEPDEIEIVIPFLSGDARQGKLSVGYGALQAARTRGSESATLTVQDVDSVFDQLKATKGKGSAERRQELLTSLFGRATDEEQDFLARLIVGELRQGALEGVMLEAVAVATGLPATELRRAATFAGGIPQVARAALHGGGLEQFSIRLMQPVLPMLAQPAADVESALEQLVNAQLEWKVDGARVQVHKSGADVRVFTRSLNDVTGAVPEIVAAVAAARADSLILDGEAVVLRPDGKPQPFQVTMRRFGRRSDDEDTRRELPLSVLFFDCLLFNNSPLIDQPVTARRVSLEAALPNGNIVPSLITGDEAEAAAFYEDALRHGHEGIMAKALDSRYEAGRRGAAWLKIKRAKTLDLVVIGVEWGSGRRKGWLSNLHLGARDPRSGGFVMLGKTFKGLTDETLEWQTRELLAREVRRDESTVYVRPELVVEIAFNDVQQSSQYPGGMALRFARVKGYRPDKRAEEADTIDSVRHIFEAQSR